MSDGTITHAVHPASSSMLRWFDYHHLPEWLQPVSQPFYELARHLLEGATRGVLTGTELTVSLRKLLEAKDAACRAAVEARSAKEPATK